MLNLVLCLSKAVHFPATVFYRGLEFGSQSTALTQQVTFFFFILFDYFPTCLKLNRDDVFDLARNGSICVGR